MYPLSYLPKEDVEAICREIMKDELIEGMGAIEELKLLQEGHRVIIPCNIEHARSMFKVATHYLISHDKDFKLTMERE